LISFRYHLVSIVAVFLALALGVLVGTTVVNQGVINDLTNRTNSASKRAADLRKQVGDLQTQINRLNSFSSIVEPLLVDNQLNGTPVVMVTQEGVDASEVDGVRKVLGDAGANVLAELVVTGRMALADEGSRAAMARLLGDPSSATPDQLTHAAAVGLGTRLAEGPGADGIDLLDGLRTAGFVAIRASSTPVASIGGADQVMVLLSGGRAAPPLDPTLFLQPLAQTLVTASQPVAAAETVDTVYPFIPLLRSDSSVDGHLITVDDADQLPGRVALVLGLRDILLSPGNGGDYGVKDGAATLIPKP